MSFCAVDRQPVLRLAWQSMTSADRLLRAGVLVPLINATHIFVTEIGGRDFLAQTPPAVP
jgi:hypothetical protein